MQIHSMNLPLIWYQTRTPKTAWTAQFMHPFHPFWIQPSVGLFILWLEYSDYFLNGNRREEYKKFSLFLWIIFITLIFEGDSSRNQQFRDLSIFSSLDL